MELTFLKYQFWVRCLEFKYSFFLNSHQPPGRKTITTIVILKMRKERCSKVWYLAGGPKQ